ncbi:hypothetical protein M3Y98_00684600 [Aphelenchoides besseyi]|nr:hypothetical protein M3Y98_00684600 [Aphelenchoides besseyi]KAI6209053.1 hypothetical protein M3Y96_00180300 [Aphelenchoides besseyi]
MLISPRLLLQSILLIVYLSILSCACTYRHRRHTSTTNSDYDLEDVKTINDDEDAIYGNGFECDGLNGHSGLFRAFNWTRGELAKISLWHATAQHYKAAELVEEKLAAVPSSRHHFPQAEIRSFLTRFKAPEAARSLFTRHELRKISQLHRQHQVDKILDLLYERLMKLAPTVRREILNYFKLAART